MINGLEFGVLGLMKKSENSRNFYNVYYAEKSDNLIY